MSGINELIKVDIYVRNWGIAAKSFKNPSKNDLMNCAIVVNTSAIDLNISNILFTYNLLSNKQYANNDN